MDTKQQSSGHQTAVLERPTNKARTDTETVEDSKPIDNRTDRPNGHSRTIRVALAAIVLSGAGLFAYRAVDGSSEPAGPADTSHETAEHQRHLSVKPVDNGTMLDSFSLADHVWRQRQAGKDSFSLADYVWRQRQAGKDSFSLADYVWRQRQAGKDPFDAAEYARMQRFTGEDGQTQDPDVESEVKFDPGPPWPPN